MTVLRDKALKIIGEKLSEVMSKSGYNKVKAENNDNTSILFAKESTGSGFAVNFEESKNQFELLSCEVENGRVSEDSENKVLSTWLFDPQSDTEREAKDIAADFAETVRGATGKAGSKKVAKKKKKGEDEDSASSLFLMNRIANIFPELKESLQQEKESYENFRGVTFAREKALPLVKEVLTSEEPKDKFKKLCTVFSNLYDAGDLDTKAIITIVFLNAIDDTTARENIGAAVSKELQIAMKEAFKLKGKKIKPEKIKKKSTFISDTLSAAQAQQAQQRK